HSVRSRRPLDGRGNLRRCGGGAPAEMAMLRQPRRSDEMPAQENAAVARELTEAFDTKDTGQLDALIADDVIWHEIGRSEPRHGKEALRAAAPGSGADYEITGRLHD